MHGEAEVIKLSAGRQQLTFRSRINVATVPSLFLLPGHTQIAHPPCRITTILGSCVSVILWDPVRKIGGATHYMLAASEARGARTARYGDVALAELLRKFMDLGIRNPRELRGWIYGGATVLGTLSGIGKDIGQNNVQVAQEWFRLHGIPLVERVTGGRLGRKVSFDVEIGKVTVEEVGQ